MLFGYRGRAVGTSILNQTLIPMLCRKAGVPGSGARGPITSHRPRSTIATQLYNAREPMSLVSLKEWLGHRCLDSTQWYATVSSDKLTQAYVDARYFERNVAVVQVLLDRNAIESGRPAGEKPTSSSILALASAPTLTGHSASTAWPASGVTSTFQETPHVLRRLKPTRTIGGYWNKPVTETEHKALEGDQAALKLPRW